MQYLKWIWSISTVCDHVSTKAENSCNFFQIVITFWSNALNTAIIHIKMKKIFDSKYMTSKLMQMLVNNRVHLQASAFRLLSFIIVTKRVIINNIWFVQRILDKKWWRWSCRYLQASFSFTSNPSKRVFKLSYAK